MSVKCYCIEVNFFLQTSTFPEKDSAIEMWGHKFDLTQDFVKTTSRTQAQPQLNSTSTQLKLTELGTTQLRLVFNIFLEKLEM